MFAFGAVAPRAVLGLHSRAAATYRRAERAVSDGAAATPRAIAHWCAVVDAAQRLHFVTGINVGCKGRCR